MSKIIFISNRLPVTVSRQDDGLTYSKSIGGLATALKGYHEQSESLWVGWPGISNDKLRESEHGEISRELKKAYKCLPVFLSESEIDLYYYGFSNKTIWPLFHYFVEKTRYNPETWQAYQEVNRRFFESVEPFIEEDDTIWIHDYHLMLLPQLIREKYPETKIGFFLHIPFPSFEIYRLLIWREELLRGLLGADLIGFHTYDYVRHFVSTAGRLLDLDNHLNKISYENRLVQVDAFPIGIDYDRFNKSEMTLDFQEEVEEVVKNMKDSKMILSIDRLDYTKGIPQRIKAFDRFLEKYPDYREKVWLYLIVAPSRELIDSYDDLRKEITELVSEVNGKYGTVSWMPIWFFFRSFSQENLIAFYRLADVLLVTPLRDGMNLVAKEYIASRSDYEGMVVISETAGAASELGETVIVNANDVDSIASGLKTALDMPRDEKIAINKHLHKRLKRYNVKFWANDFLETLDQTVENSSRAITQQSIDADSSLIERAYEKARKRLLLFDYDGTLVGFTPIPQQAKPDEELKKLLAELVKDPKNTVVIVSGRDRHELYDWLGNINLHMLAAHGLWLYHPGEEWKMTAALDNTWKDAIRPMLELYADRMPGSFIEEKDFSLAFHYRQCEPSIIPVKVSEIREALLSMTQSTSLGLQEGNKVLEIKDNRVNKGYVTAAFIQDENYDFILGAGDDFTDEDLFSALPESAFTIKIGTGNTIANFRMRSWRSMRWLLGEFAASDFQNQQREADNTASLRTK
jgi:trehalose 6-phosphate synthase/phosphatase